MSSLGTNLPPELFDNILYLLEIDPQTDPSHDIWTLEPVSATSRRTKEIPLCMLRLLVPVLYWARRLTRPHTVYSTTLFSDRMTIIVDCGLSSDVLVQVLPLRSTLLEAC